MKSKLIVAAIVAVLLIAGCATAPSDDGVELQLTDQPTDAQTPADTQQQNERAQEQSRDTIVKCDAQPTAATPSCDKSDETTDTTKTDANFTELETPIDMSTETPTEQSTETATDTPDTETEQPTEPTEQQPTDEQTPCDCPETETEQQPTDDSQSDTPDEQPETDTDTQSPPTDDGSDEQTDTPPADESDDQQDNQDEEPPTDDGDDEQPPADDGDDQQDETPSNETDTPSNETDTPDDGGEEPPQNETETPSNDTDVEVPDGYAVRIIYDGEWSGNYDSGTSIQSISGTGTAVFAIDTDGQYIVTSVLAQKEDGSSNTLTVQILHDGEVVRESSTSAAYGIAQVSYSEQLDDGDGDEIDDTYSVRISYDGEWMGAYGAEDSLVSIDGTGTKTFEVDGGPFVVVVNAQKMDDSSGTLTVQILKNGEVIKEKSTSAPHGFVQISVATDRLNERTAPTLVQRASA